MGVVEETTQSATQQTGNQPVSCKIEHQAVIFALIAKRTIEHCGEDAEKVIQEGMIRYGKERGARMAANAKANGDPLNTMTNQAYGEWVPDYPGQMEFGWVRTEPTLQTYISKCAWCEAWKKYDLLEYGKLYCVHVDAAVYCGFREDLVCTPLTTSMSFGGERCEFDWQYPLTPEDVQKLQEKKAELGTGCMKNFNYHTSHMLHTVGGTVRERFGSLGDQAVEEAIRDYIELFGQEYYDVLDTNQDF